MTLPHEVRDPVAAARVLLNAATMWGRAQTFNKAEG